MNIKTDKFSIVKDEDKARRLREMQGRADTFSQKTENARQTAGIQLLNGLLSRVESMQSTLFSGRSWNRLMRAYASAKAISMRDSPNARALNRAVRNLKRALSRLEPVDKTDEDDERREGLPVVINLSRSATGASANQAAAAEKSVEAGE